MFVVYWLVNLSAGLEVVLYGFIVSAVYAGYNFPEFNNEYVAGPVIAPLWFGLTYCNAQALYYHCGRIG